MQPSVTLVIVLVNVIISLIALNGVPKIIEVGILQPYRTVRNHTWYELITSGFLHANTAHLAFNMITLFFFGPYIERSIGIEHFLILYFSGLIVSSLPSLIRHKDNPEYATLGASGAVEAVLFAAIFLFPHDTLYLFLAIPIKAWVFAVLFLGYSIYESTKGRGNINHEAHIAGAVWGIIYMVAFIPGSIDHFLSVWGLI